MKKLLIFLIIICPIIGCDRYKPFASQYKFKSKNGLPDYSDLNYWAAHPWKKDPSDSIPLPLRGEKRDSAVDVFFLHPTTHTKRSKKKILNAAIDDSYI